MKTSHAVLTSFIFTFLLTACFSDQELENNLFRGIAGEWRLEQFKITLTGGRDTLLDFGQVSYTFQAGCEGSREPEACDLQIDWKGRSFLHYYNVAVIGSDQTLVNMSPMEQWSSMEDDIFTAYNLFGGNRVAVFQAAENLMLSSSPTENITRDVAGIDKTQIQKIALQLSRVK